jgi:CRP-like cAMP-binding protein
MEELLQFLNSVYPLSPALEDHLRKILKYKEIKSKEYLLKAGHISERVCFITKGLLRCYYEKGDHEVCSWFMREGDVIFAVKSFYSQTPSYESIQALENCELYYITYNELQHIYKTYIEFNVHRGVLTEKYYLLSEERSASMRLHKSPERYQYLLDYHPELVRRVHVKYIASYIGVSLPTMTRLKRKIRKGK